MVANDIPSIPLVELRPVSDSAHQWVAVSARLASTGDEADPRFGWPAVFNSGDLLTAIAPLDCIVHLSSLAPLSAALLARMPPGRVLLACAANVLGEEDATIRLAALQGAGYRILIDGALRSRAAVPPTLRAVAHDCSDALALATPLAGLFGPHLAHGITSPDQFDACCKAGFNWFIGIHAQHAGAAIAARSDDEGITARRLLKLLGLLLADADTREIESQLKQDPALSFQLLRLVNSAAFAPATPIHNFAQAIDRLGRRQLLRWLQLLLYARPRDDGKANPLLPIAAMRAAQIESLCKQHGCDADQQDLAFQVGVFSLLDVLLGMPMGDIVSALHLPAVPARALLAREGVMGGLLALVETDAPAPAALAAQHVTPAQWWASQLDGLHWAIQVSRNL